MQRGQGDGDKQRKKPPKSGPMGHPGRKADRVEAERSPLPRTWKEAEQVTLMEALAKRESCLMCCPFFPMMAPTACAGMNTCTVSCSGACCRGRACYHRGQGTA